MKFKRELINAVQLFLLLSLLFWSFTWNSSPYFDFSRPNFPTDGVQKSTKGGSYVTDRNSILFESFSEVKCESGKTTKPVPNVGSLPSFNEWREKEMTKYEKSLTKTSDHYYNKNDKNPTRRKLNYASSKCGAKVLASNPEARYRIAVLSEKPDEYMLNPCRAKKWFIVELCDTVEATQFELANYELYSSSPREFSVFWSDVYPTAEWHLLGNFEAKDQRRMQTFGLSVKNLGKFIKVVIYNHHGREHYCTLSAIRVLGYSMVHKFEDIETSESGASHAPDDVTATQTEKNSQKFKKEQLPAESTATRRDVSCKNANLKICSFFFMHCATTSEDELCVEAPLYRFLAKVMLKSVRECHEIFCFNPPIRPLEIHSTKEGESRTDLSNSSVSNATYRSVNGSCSTNKDNLKIRDEKELFTVPKRGNDLVSDKSYITREKSDSETGEQNSGKNHTKEINTTSDAVHDRPAELPRRSSAGDTRETCKCAVEPQVNLQAGERAKANASQTLSVEEDTVESAGLSHTESVIFKLTSRVKASEKDLNLINKYLQQLSQSYRQQISDMKAMFDKTLKAIDVQSEKTRTIDKKQDENIIFLQKRTKELHSKIDFLMNSQKDMLKRVVELHGFFLILELIIISTVFTIFINIFQRKNDSMMGDRMKINYFRSLPVK